MYLNRNIKISLGLVLLLSILIVPYFFGFLAEQSYRNNMVAIEKHFNDPVRFQGDIKCRVETLKYNKGWFTSTAKNRVTLSFAMDKHLVTHMEKGDENQNLAMKQGVQIAQNMLKISWEDNATVYHGPILFAKLPNKVSFLHFGKAYVKSDSRLSMPILALFLGDGEINIINKIIISFGNKFSHYFTLEKNHYEIFNTKINFNDLVMRGTYPADVAKLNMTTKLDSLVVLGEWGKFLLTNSQATDDNDYTSHKIPLSKNNLSIDAIDLSLAKTKSNVSIKNVKIFSETKINPANNAYCDGTFSLGVDKAVVKLPPLVLNEMTVLNPLKINVNLIGFDINEIQQLLKNKQYLTLTNKSMWTDAVNVFTPLFTDSSAIKFNFENNSDQGGIKIKGNIKSVYPLPKDMTKITKFSQVLDKLSLDIMVNGKLAETIISYGDTLLYRHHALQKEQEAKEKNIDIKEYKSPPTRDSKIIIREWMDAGLIKKKDDAYLLKLELKNDKIIINGYDFYEIMKK